jgi:hypothetical protein
MSMKKVSFTSVILLVSTLFNLYSMVSHFRDTPHHIGATVTMLLCVGCFAAALVEQLRAIEVVGYSFLLVAVDFMVWEMNQPLAIVYSVIVVGMVLLNLALLRYLETQVAKVG